MEPHTVFVLDDEATIRNSLASLLKSEGFDVETFPTGQDFLANFDPARLGCLILDLRMPQMSGLEVQQELIRRGSQIPIVFLTAFGDIPTTVGAIKAGAEEFLTKPPDVDQLIGVVRRLLEKCSSERSSDLGKAEIRRKLDRLSAREIGILKLAVAGSSSREIAEKLSLSPRTVENHRLRIGHKLEINSLLEFSYQAALCGIDLRQLDAS